MIASGGMVSPMSCNSRGTPFILGTVTVGAFSCNHPVKQRRYSIFQFGAVTPIVTASYCLSTGAAEVGADG